MTTANAGRRRKVTTHDRKVFGVVVDAELVRAVGQLADLGIVANRSAAVEEGLRMLVAIHRDRLPKRELEASHEAVA